MRIRALRGVCIGVERHLAVGAEADLEPAQVQFLKSIGAVETLPDAPPEAVAAEVQQTLLPAEKPAAKPATPSPKT